MVAIYQKVGVLKFSGYQDLEKDSPADCQTSVQIFRKSTARSSPLQDFWLDRMSLTLPSIMCFVDLEKVYWGELWEYGVCLLLQATGSMYNQSQSCPHFWHKIRHVFSGCWAPPGLNFISNPICHIH